MKEKSMEEMKREHFKFVDKCCKDIAQSRRMAEIEGIDMDEFDKHLNECCAKWAEHYADMNPLTLALEGIGEIFAAGEGENFIRDLKAKMGDSDGKENS